MIDAEKVVRTQRDFFDDGGTRSLELRIAMLTKLRRTLVAREDDVYRAVRADMGRSDVETFFNELYLNVSEIDFTLKHIKEWTSPQRKRTPSLFFMADSELYAEPYGVSLIISAWNYPLLQLISPLVGAIAAGNTAVLKPAEESSHCSALAAEIINDTFPPQHAVVIEGSTEVTTRLLEQKLDYIFFTGSPRVGRIVQAAAAKSLTPTTLELGGKSPAIVDETADIVQAAKRIIWCKLSNTGQLCITVDHCYVQESVHDAFVAACKKWIDDFYGRDPSSSPDYGFIINERNFDRAVKLLDSGQVAHGGQHDRARRYIAPTILTGVRESSPVMQEEIFAPILPVLPYASLDTLLAQQRRKDKPLALYFFSSDGARVRELLQATSSGGVTINDCLSHCGTPHLPFGGVGNSGMGGYHGKYSFDTFTHYKAVMHAPTAQLLDLSLKYPPYAGKLPKLRKLAKYGII